jgi:hypothetical protein
MAGFYHGLNGVGIAVARLGARTGIGRLSPRAMGGASAFAAIAMAAALLGFGGVWFDVGDVASSAFAQLAQELVGLEVESVAHGP